MTEINFFCLIKESRRGFQKCCVKIWSTTFSPTRKQVCPDLIFSHKELGLNHLNNKNKNNENETKNFWCETQIASRSNDPGCGDKHGRGLPVNEAGRDGGEALAGASRWRATGSARNWQAIDKKLASHWRLNSSVFARSKQSTGNCEAMLKY